MGGLNTSTPSLLGLSYDVFHLILEYLSKTDLLHLLQTCSNLKNSLVVQEAIFTQPFSDADEPDKGETFWLFHSLIHRLDATNGYLVQSMVMHKDAEGEHLSILQRLCPNLHGINFLMVMDTIDHTSSHCLSAMEARQIGCINKCVVVHYNEYGKFCFRRMIIMYPGFFHRLKSMSLAYEAYAPIISENERPSLLPPNKFHDEFSRDYSASNEDWLIKLLDLCTNLEHLALYKRPEHWDKSGERSHPRLFLKLVECLSHASKLSHLKLYNMDKVLRNQFLFLETLSQNIKHVTITLNLNLKYYDYCRDYSQSSTFTDREREINRATLRTADDYLLALKEALGHRRHIFHLSGDQSDGPVRALRHVQGVADPLFDPAHAAWLKKELDWDPTFDWSEMVHLESRYQEAPFDPPSTQLAVCNNFFQEIKNHGVPIRLRLSGEEYDSTLFAAADPNVVNADDYFDGRIPKSATISNWHLETIGNLVDELQLFWSEYYPSVNSNELITEEDQNELRGHDRYCKDNKNAKDWAAWRNARHTHCDAILQQRIIERCELETELVSDFFDRLPTVLPNVTTIKLHVPSDLYRTVVQKANQDITNNDAWYPSILPGRSGWRVVRGEDDSGYCIVNNPGESARSVKLGRKFFNRTFTRKLKLV